MTDPSIGHLHYIHWDGERERVCEREGAQAWLCIYYQAKLGKRDGSWAWLSIYYQVMVGDREEAIHGCVYFIMSRWV